MGLEPRIPLGCGTVFPTWKFESALLVFESIRSPPLSIRRTRHRPARGGGAADALALSSAPALCCATDGSALLHTPLFFFGWGQHTSRAPNAGPGRGVRRRHRGLLGGLPPGQTRLDRRGAARAGSDHVRYDVARRRPNGHVWFALGDVDRDAEVL